MFALHSRLSAAVLAGAAIALVGCDGQPVRSRVEDNIGYIRVSSFSEQTFDGVKSAIDKLTEGRTSVTIAHRLSTAQSADEVLVFDQGHLVERGQHRDLVVCDGVYAALYADWAAGTKSV